MHVADDLMKEWVLVSLVTREFAKNDLDGFIVHRGPRPPHVDDYPREFTPRKGGWSYAEVVETKIDPKHRGQPKYIQEDWQVARISKIVAPPKV